MFNPRYAMAALMLAFSPLGHAATIDFGIVAPTDGGSITYDTLGGTLNGYNIEIDEIVDLDSGNPSIACQNCVLNFQTGNNTGGWNFAGGGFIEIVGGVSDAGIAPGATLLYGEFVEGSVSDHSFSMYGFDFSFQIAGAGFVTPINDDLANHFGISSGLDYLGGMNISFSTGYIPEVGDTFSSTSVNSGDVVAAPVVVPLPASVWLLGTGLLGLVAVGRRKV